MNALESTQDPVSQLIIATIIVAVFTILSLEKVHRVLVVIAAVSLIWAITYLTPFRLISFEAAQNAIDLNVLFLLAAMMAVVGVLKSTGVFEWAAARILQRTGGDSYLVLFYVTWFTAVLSALCDNVTTVIFVTPMALQMSRTMKVNPIALLIPVVMASNIGGSATLIGDPPNIMIGSGANLTFLDFILNLTAPVAVMMLVLPRISARYYGLEPGGESTRATMPLGETPQIRDPRLLRWSLWITAFIFIGFLTHGLTGMPTSVPAVIGGGALLVTQDLLYLRTHRATPEERQQGLLNIIENEIEWPTLSFFLFLFITVGAAVQTGLIDTLARALEGVVQGGASMLGLGPAATLLFAALLIVWVSAFFSAIIDNIPFVAVMIPIIHRITGQFAIDATVLWWALALGACLGGNATPIGASANVTVLGIAEKFGGRTSFADFTRFGARVTAITLVISSLFLATHVYLGSRAALAIWSVPLLVAVLLKGVPRLSAGKTEKTAT